MKKEKLPKGSLWKIMRFWVFLFFFMLFVIVLLGAILPICSIKKAQQLGGIQTCRTIALSLFQYSQDHSGTYPEGKSSTEVFQRLLDEGYISDPSIFYVGYMRMPGKVRPKGMHLKAENVSWDITCCVDSSSPDKLPVVFLTGYKITYQPGAAAVLLRSPPPRTWSQWSDGMPAWEPFMAVACKDNFASSRMADKDGTIPNFIPADFDPKGKTYRQLTP